MIVVDLRFHHLVLIQIHLIFLVNFLKVHHLVIMLLLLAVESPEVLFHLKLLVRWKNYLLELLKK
jgi:hypothetical protein